MPQQSLVLRVLQDRLVRRARLVLKGHRAPRVLTERTGRLGRLVPRVLLGLRASLASLVRREQLAHVPAQELIKILVPKKGCHFYQV